LVRGRRGGGVACGPETDANDVVAKHETCLSCNVTHHRFHPGHICWRVAHSLAVGAPRSGAGRNFAEGKLRLLSMDASPKGLLIDDAEKPQPGEHKRRCGE
jgi:hypothetical protein